jgi:hypothetical protein
MSASKDQINVSRSYMQSEQFELQNKSHTKQEVISMMNTFGRATSKDNQSNEEDSNIDGGSSKSSIKSL